MKYKTEAEKNRMPYIEQNYGTVFNMERVDYLFDQLSIIHDDLPRKFFYDKKVYESFNLLRGHVYSISLENRFKLTTRELNRMRKPSDVSHKDALSQFICKDKFFVVPSSTDLNILHSSKVDRYEMDLMQSEDEENYLKKAFQNMEYTYAVGNYAILMARLIDSILEDMDYESKVIGSMTTDLFLWGVTTCQSATTKILPFAVMSKDQALIDRAMFIIGKDRFIKNPDGLNYSIVNNLIPMCREQTGYVNAKHEDVLRQQINEYYGIN